MATTASVHTNTYGGRTITLKVEEISTSIENNTSTVKWTLSSGTSSTYHSVYDITAWVNGTASSNKVYGSKTAEWSTRAFPCKDGSTSGTLTIPHNADGTASPVPFRLRGSVYNNNPQNYDGSIDLTTIPRASSFTLSGGTIGSTISVSITRASNTFTHKVYCTYGGKTQVLSNDAGTSASATLDMDFCNYITTSTSASATMFVETYSSGTYVGTTSTQFTMSVPSSVVPTISSVTKSDTSNLLATYGAYVQSKSNLRVQTSASGSYSSTISNIIVNTKDSNNNIIRTLNGSDVTFNGVNYVGTATVEVIITDSRGRQATNTSTINVVGYSNPTISYFTAERLNNDSTVTFTWNASITNINNANTNSKSFKIYKRQAGTSSWGSAIFSSTSAYTYTSSGSTNTCDADYGWEFKFEATDSFTTSTFNITIGTAFELMNWKADGTALAIGKVSEESNTFEVALNSKFRSGLSSYNGIEISHTTPYIDFHYNNSTSDYTSRIIEETSGTLTFGSNIKENGSLLINTPTDVWSGLEIRPSNRNESSVAYHNAFSNTRTVTGCGTANFDGYGIYMDDIGSNALTIDRQGNVIHPFTHDHRKTFYLPFTGADDAPQWFLLARFSKNIYDGSNLSMLVISGTFGGWFSGDRTIFKFTFGDRGGYTCYGYQAGNNSAFNDSYDFEVYENGDIKELYLHRKARWVSEALLDIQGEDIEIFNSSTPTSPSGNLVYTIGSWLPNLSQLNDVVLYNDDNGTNGNVNLSESAGNFRYLEIYYVGDGCYNSTKIYNANNKNVTLTVNNNWVSGSSKYLNIRTKNISISGNQITSNRNDWTQILNTGVNSHNTNNEIYITRVVGYRW